MVRNQGGVERSVRCGFSDPDLPRAMIDHQPLVGECRRSPARARVALAVIIVFFTLSTAFATLVSIVSTGVPDTWTFMVYMDGDNDIEHDAIVDFFEMSAVDSAPNLNIVVQFDRYGGEWGHDDTSYGNWTDCKRFVITHGMAPTSANATMDIGEVDMADPQTLKDFVNWTLANYPANHYALDFWDHGGDWYGLCWDANSGGVLQLGQMGDALRALHAANPSLVYDIIALDTCSMGSIEVAYELEGQAEYLLASEIYVPDDGLNYSSLQAIIDAPGIATTDLCARFMTDYSAYYNSLLGTPEEHQLNESFTLSTIDLGAIDPLVHAIDSLAGAMIANRTSWWTQVQQARLLTQDYNGWAYDDVVDIYSLCARLGNALVGDQGARSLISNVMNAFNASVVGEIHGTNPANCIVPVDQAKGLTINFPGATACLDPMYLWNGNRFQAGTRWDEFLGAFRDGLPYPASYGPTGSAVPVGSAVTVWVSEPINTGLPYMLKVYPSGEPGSPVNGTVVYDASGNKLEFTPESDLLPGVSYTVVVSFYDPDYRQGGSSWEFSTATNVPEFPTPVLPILLILLLVTITTLRRARKPE